ncbi:unnamed protein product [Diatraea saccharalis]|uniref:lysoplasmalogenase n=1 Tax=Diatraea saccharalis TaxID=40085 RepID=A0A9N9QT72_9NEOP|nr:unnamed protein product [Diatraea saccharalis]
MLSPTQLLKRIGVGGGLVPFFKCVCVYFAAGSGIAPSAAAVAAKVAPILCLLLFVLIHHGPSMHQKPNTAFEGLCYATARGWYARRIALGLALSAVGDALLVFPQRLAGGMAWFAGAHVAYMAAFGWRPRAAALGAALAAATALFCCQLRPPAELRVAVPAYSVLLGGMAWRGAARGGTSAAGALLFLLSDAILSYSLFAGPVPYKQAVVMSTYYLGQLGIAVSVLDHRRIHGH